MEYAKKAIITGITGQDGSFLAELLHTKNYEVHGVMRRASTFNTGRIDHIYQDPHTKGAWLHLHYGDLADSSTLHRLVFKIQPDEVYNLGAQSHVRVSFEIPEYTADIVALGTIRLLEALREYEGQSGKKVKFYQASSSEMFGSAPSPQNEQTPFHPRSPYGVAKVFSYYSTINYREAYGMFAANGILFNHESERRGETFVTRKITRGVARILGGLDKKIYLGNLDARRDWGYAPEYVEGMWRILQQDSPDDFVLGTGEAHSVREFVAAAFAAAGITEWQSYVETDSRYLRPAEVENLIADPSKAKKVLGWEVKVKFAELVKIMMKHDLAAFGVKETTRKV